MNLEKRISRLEDDSGMNEPKIHFITWRQDHFMTDEEYKAMLDPKRDNIVIEGLPTKEDYAEFGDIIRQEIQEAKEENQRKHRRKKDVTDS